jgi:hypothetical protein
MRRGLEGLSRLGSEVQSLRHPSRWRLICIVPLYGLYAEVCLRPARPQSRSGQWNRETVRAGVVEGTAPLGGYDGLDSSLLSTGGKEGHDIILVLVLIATELHSRFYRGRIHAALARSL